MSELEMISKKLLVQSHYIKNIMGIIDEIIEQNVKNEKKLIKAIDMLEYFYMKIEIISFCIEEVRKGKEYSTNYLMDIYNENEINIKDFENKIKQL